MCLKGEIEVDGDPAVYGVGAALYLNLKAPEGIGPIDDGQSRVHIGRQAVPNLGQGAFCDLGAKALFARTTGLSLALCAS